MKVTNYLLALAVALLATACHSSKKVTEQNAVENVSQQVKTPAKVMGGTAVSTSPVVYVYKMKADYSHQVPVLMDESRTRILSFPDPKDLLSGDKLRLPTQLKQGYWLDNKGIGPNVAFLTYTYEEYSHLPSAPSVKELLAHLLDKEPLTELRECGRWADYTDIVSELNQKIAAGWQE